MSYFGDILASEPWLAFRFTEAELGEARAKLFDGKPDAERKPRELVMPRRAVAKPELHGEAKRLHDRAVAKRLHDRAVAEQVAIAERTGYAGEILLAKIDGLEDAARGGGE